MLDDLKREVCEANRELIRRGLAVATWGNASGRDRETGWVAIKPSGIPADRMKPEDMTLVDPDGRVVEGRWLPSTDTPTHLALYREWPALGGVVHTHSMHATMFAQAVRELPCLGTTHADYFRGAIPVTRDLTAAEVAGDYEANTGRVIVERFGGINPMEIPGVLVARHAPFVWGRDVRDAVENATVLERLAEMACRTLEINPGVSAAPDYLVEKHYARKHGAGAYYGQGAGIRDGTGQKTMGAGMMRQEALHA